MNNNDLTFNIALLGCVSVGKSTFINSIIQNIYAETKIDKCTKCPQIFETNKNVEYIDNIKHKIEEINGNLVNNFSDDICKEVTMQIPRNNIFNDFNNIEFKFYDIPGLNDSKTSDKMYKYIENNFNKFNMIIFCINIETSLSTIDELKILNFIKNKYNKNIKILVVCNKCDNEVSKEEDREIQFSNIKKTLLEEGIEYPVLKYSSRYTNYYRSINTNTFKEDPKLISELGEKIYSEANWDEHKNKSIDEKIELIQKKINKKKDIYLQQSGYNKLNKTMTELITESLDDILCSKTFYNISKTHLTFGLDFKQELKDYIPNSITHVTFNYNINIKEGDIPKSVTHLTFGEYFNQELKEGDIPNSVIKLTFGKSFNQKIKEGDIPKSVTHLTFGRDFNQELKEGYIPKSVTQLNLGYWFNQKLKEGDIPNSVIKLTFSWNFDQELKENDIPNSVTHLTFGEYFNQELKEGDIPNSVTHLTFGRDFNQELKEGNIPNSVIKLTFGEYFNQELKEGNIPNSVIKLTFNRNIKTIKKYVLPISLKTIKLINYDDETLKLFEKLPYDCIVVDNNNNKINYLFPTLLNIDSKIYTDPTFNIGILGCISTGKSTLMNSLFAQTYSDMKIKKTTMCPQVYQTNSKLDISNICAKEIRKLNEEYNNKLYELGTLNKCDEIVHNVLPIYDIFDNLKISTNMEFKIYDIPGLNDSSTKNIFYDYIRNNFYKFDLIIYNIDINSGLNTTDELDILHLIKDCIIKNKKNFNKDVKLLILCNKCDDMFINDQGCIMGSDEIEEMYKQVCETVKINDINCPIIKYSAAYTYMYRSINMPENLDKSYIDKIGIDNMGRVSWIKNSKDKNINQLWELIKPILSNNIVESLELSGFNNLKNIICNEILHDSFDDLIYSKINFHNNISDFESKYNFLIKIKNIFGTLYKNDKMHLLLTDYLNYLKCPFKINNDNIDDATQYYNILCYLEKLDIGKLELDLIKIKLDNYHELLCEYNINFIKDTNIIEINTIFPILRQIIEKTKNGIKLITNLELINNLQKVPIDNYYNMVMYLYNNGIDFKILKNLYATKIINYYNKSCYKSLLKNYIFKYYLKSDDEFYNWMCCCCINDNFEGIINSEEYDIYIKYFITFNNFYNLK